MQPGERRTLKSLLVEFQQAVPIELTAKDYESTKLPSGPRELLRIETVTRLADGQKMEQTVWTDRAGEVLKTLAPVMGGLETYRVTRAEALDALRRRAVGFAAEYDGQNRASAAKRPSHDAGLLPRPPRRRQSGEGVCRRAVAVGQTDRRPYGRGDGLRHSTGLERRQSDCAADLPTADDLRPTASCKATIR